MASFVQTGTVLDQILENTRREVEACERDKPLAALMSDVSAAPPLRDFRAALRRRTVTLIAEVKHASPSRGVLIEPFDPLSLALCYAQNGAAAISVLTDKRFFQGHLDHLKAIRAVVDVPLLRKDFVIDPYQVYEARAAGADAILLIVAALADDQLAGLCGLAGTLGISALVEVHDGSELERALRVNATVVGINNRDLKTFQVDTGLTQRLAQSIPEGVVVVAESGIRSAQDVRRMGEIGADAVLVGEGLVTAQDIAAQVRSLSNQPKGQKRDTN